MRTGRQSDPGRRSLLLDPLGPALAAVSAVVYLLRGFDGYLTRDLALYAYANQQVAEGVWPYLAVVNRSGPISHAFAAPGVLGARMFGADDLLGIRIWCLGLAALCVWVTYLLARDVLDSRLAGVASAAALLTVNGFTQYAASGPREKTAMVLFVLIGLLAMARRHHFWAGFFISLATLTWQPAFFGAAVAAGVAALAPAYDSFRTRLRGLGAVALGGLLPLVGFLVWYAAMGRLQEFLDCFVLIHLNYTVQPGLMDLDWYRVLTEAYGVSLWVLALGSVVLLGRSVWILAGAERRRDHHHWSEVALGAGLLAGIIWSVRVFNGWPDIFFMLPMAVVGVGGLVRILVDNLPRLLAAGVTVAWGLAAVALAVTFSLSPHSETLPDQQAETEAVMDLLPDDATIVSIEAPQALVLTGKRNPLRHQMFGLGLSTYVDDTFPGGRDGFRRTVATLQPTVITLGKYRREWMFPLLERDYVAIGRSPGWAWYVNRSVGSDVLTELMSRSDP